MRVWEACEDVEGGGVYVMGRVFNVWRGVMREATNMC